MTIGHKTWLIKSLNIIYIISFAAIFASASKGFNVKCQIHYSTNIVVYMMIRPTLSWSRLPKHALSVLLFPSFSNLVFLSGYAVNDMIYLVWLVFTQHWSLFSITKFPFCQKNKQWEGFQYSGGRVANDSQNVFLEL